MRAKGNSRKVVTIAQMFVLKWRLLAVAVVAA